MFNCLTVIFLDFFIIQIYHETILEMFYINFELSSVKNTNDIFIYIENPFAHCSL